VYLNSTDKLLRLGGGFKVHFEKLVSIVCVASLPRYKLMSYCCPCRVCNHPCSSAAVCSCVFRGNVEWVHVAGPAALNCSPCFPCTFLGSLRASPRLFWVSLSLCSLQQSDVCVYLRRNNTNSLCVRRSSRKWQDGSAIVSEILLNVRILHHSTFASINRLVR
jgi:hypothetical protein